MKIRSSRLTDDHGEWKPVVACENLDLRGGDHGYTATNGVHDTAMMQTMRRSHGPIHQRRTVEDIAWKTMLRASPETWGIAATRSELLRHSVPQSGRERVSSLKLVRPSTSRLACGH
jgi:hypothetical protein